MQFSGGAILSSLDFRLTAKRRDSSPHCHGRSSVIMVTKQDPAGEGHPGRPWGGRGETGTETPGGGATRGRPRGIRSRPVLYLHRQDTPHQER